MQINIRQIIKEELRKVLKEQESSASKVTKPVQSISVEQIVNELNKFVTAHRIRTGKRLPQGGYKSGPYNNRVQWDEMSGYFYMKSPANKFEADALAIVANFYNSKNTNKATGLIKNAALVNPPGLYEMVNAYGAAAQTLLMNMKDEKYPYFIIKEWGPYYLPREGGLLAHDDPSLNNWTLNTEAWSEWQNWTKKVKGEYPPKPPYPIMKNQELEPFGEVPDPPGRPSKDAQYDEKK